MTAVIIRCFFQKYDNASGIRQNPTMGGYQFSAVEPYPASAGESVFRLVQSDRGAAVGASLDCDLAAVRRSRPERIANAALHELARLLHTSAETRRASGRHRPAYLNQPLGWHCRRLRTDRRERADPGQGIPLHIA